MSDDMVRLQPRYSLKQAVERFFPNGPLTVGSLRTEIKRGRLQVSRVAGKFLVTEAAIAEMLEACEECQIPEKPPVSTSDAVTADRRPGSSSTERLKLAQAAAHSIATELKKRSPSILRKSTSPPVPFRRENSGSPK
jgi:hypothetical protein